MTPLSVSLPVSDLQASQTFYFWSNKFPVIYVGFSTASNGTYYLHYLTSFGKPMKKRFRNMNWVVYLSPITTHLHKI